MAEKKQVVLHIPNISCHHCIMAIQKEVKRFPQAKFIAGDVDRKEVTLEYEGDVLADIKAVLAEIGYPVSD